MPFDPRLGIANSMLELMTNMANLHRAGVSSRNIQEQTSLLGKDIEVKKNYLAKQEAEEKAFAEFNTKLDDANKEIESVLHDSKKTADEKAQFIFAKKAEIKTSTQKMHGHGGEFSKVRNDMLDSSMNDHLITLQSESQNKFSPSVQLRVSRALGDVRRLSDMQYQTPAGVSMFDPRTGQLVPGAYSQERREMENEKGNRMLQMSQMRNDAMMNRLLQLEIIRSKAQDKAHQHRMEEETHRIKERPMTPQELDVGLETKRYRNVNGRFLINVGAGKYVDMNTKEPVLLDETTGVISDVAPKAEESTNKIFVDNNIVPKSSAEISTNTHPYLHGVPPPPPTQPKKKGLTWGSLTAKHK